MPKLGIFSSIIAMFLGAVVIMNAASYFPEFVKAQSASGLLFSTMSRVSKTGDYKQGEKIVRSVLSLRLFSAYCELF